MSIERHAQKEIELVARLRAANERIAQAEVDAGAAYVDAEDGQSTSASVDAVLHAKAEVALIDSAIRTVRAVSYTHLDVYKRQVQAGHGPTEGLHCRLLRAARIGVDHDR